MINSVGVDMVEVSEIQRLVDTFGDDFIRQTFTEEEARRSRQAPHPAEFLAGRFAAKEAVYKAVARFTQAGDFDFRMVEVLDEPDGSPAVQMVGPLQALLDEAGIGALHLSLAHQGGFALAFVVAERK